MKHLESEFEGNFAFLATVFNMRYIKIPDVVPIKRAGFIPIAKKRPFDGVLITSHGNYLIECKINYGQQKEHQKLWEEEINKINNTYYLIRKKVYAKTRKVEYVVEQNGDKIFKTENIERLFYFFQDPQEHTSQKIMIDVFLPEKKKKLKRKVIV